MAVEQNLFTPSTNKNLLGLVSIVVSPTDLCNRACSFCPHSKNFPNKKNYMSLDLANKLANELYSYDYDGIISISGYGEPLLHPNIGELIKCFTSRNIATRLITNGDRILYGRFLPEEIDSWNLMSIKIDCYDGESDVKSMNSILRNLKTFKRISTGPTTISNRGGYLAKEKINLPCYQPSMKSIVDYDGNVYVCCEDWSKKVSFGSVYKQSFSSIWMSKKLNIVRKQLLNSKREFYNCVNCNIKPENTINESESYRIWNYYK